MFFVDQTNTTIICQLFQVSRELSEDSSTNFGLSLKRQTKLSGRVRPGDIWPTLSKNSIRPWRLEQIRILAVKHGPYVAHYSTPFRYLHL